MINRLHVQHQTNPATKAQCAEATVRNADISPDQILKLLESVIFLFTSFFDILSICSRSLTFSHIYFKIKYIYYTTSC